MEQTFRKTCSDFFFRKIHAYKTIMFKSDPEMIKSFYLRNTIVKENETDCLFEFAKMQPEIR